MSNPLQFFKNLFSQQEKNPNLPVLQEILERSETEIAAYEAWKVNENRGDALFYLQRQYNSFLLESYDRSLYRGIDTDKIAGFILYFNPAIFSPEEFVFFFDLLKEKVLELSYFNYLSDVRYFNRTSSTETIERHYQKPRLAFDEKGEKAKQAFGNVNIELVKRNETVVHIKLLATFYSDHLFEPSENFDGLMQHFFEE